MPILDAETSLYPDQLLKDWAPDESHGDDERNWLVLMTKPSQEKSLARQLVSQRVPFYLPLIQKDNMIRGRKVSSYKPLFASYVFLYGNDDDRYAALKTNRIIQTLEVQDQPQLWSDLRQLQRLIDEEAPLTVESRLQAGRRVRIKSGTMMGLEGTVIARRHKLRLLVAVHFMQAGVSVEIDDYMLEPID